MQQISSVKDYLPKYKEFRKIIKKKTNDPAVKWGGGGEEYVKRYSRVKRIRIGKAQRTGWKKFRLEKGPRYR